MTTTNMRSTYVALVAALREEFNDQQREALWIQMREHRYNTSSLGVLAQAVHDAQDMAYDTTGHEAIGRQAAAADIREMPRELGDQGWKALADQAAEAGYDRAVVYRRRRGDSFTTLTVEAAYQYGYRQAARVARGGVA